MLYDYNKYVIRCVLWKMVIIGYTKRNSWANTRTRMGCPWKWQVEEYKSDPEGDREKKRPFSQLVHSRQMLAETAFWEQDQENPAWPYCSVEKARNGIINRGEHPKVISATFGYEKEIRIVLYKIIFFNIILIWLYKKWIHMYDWLVVWTKHYRLITNLFPWIKMKKEFLINQSGSNWLQILFKSKISTIILMRKMKYRVLLVH